MFDSIDDYLSDGHMQKDEKIKTFQDLFYDDYMSKRETILIITNMSKKEWRRLIRSINNNTFYPIKKIRIVSDDPIEKSMLKIKFTSNLVVNDFYEKYHSGIDDDSIWRNIYECPYCHSDNFIIINDIEEFEKSGLSIVSLPLNQTG